MKTKKEEVEDLNFNDNVEFFGETDLIDPSEAVVQALSEVEIVAGEEEEEEEVTTIGDNKKPKAKKEKKEEEEEELDFFAESADVDETLDIKKEKAPSTPQTSTPGVSAFNFLKEKGFIEHELQEGEELTDELAEELLEERWEASVDEAIEEMTKNLPVEGKEFLKFLSKGGDPTEYLSTLAAKSVDLFSGKADIEDETIQQRVMENNLREQGYDDEYIEAHIQTLKDTGKLASVSKKIFDKKLEEKQNLAKSMTDQREKAIKAAKERQKKFNTEMRDYVASLEDVKGYKLSPTDKKVLADFASKPTVTLEDGRTISELQAGIFAAMADKEKLVLLSKIIKEDFDLSFVEKKAITKHTKELVKGGNGRKAEPVKRVRDLLSILDEE